jgi:NAD(P)-dependent dehydrogenase (short-subunit alcohol dehydrogenase family)
MRIIVVGATGTIGTPLAAALAARHEVVRVGNRNGEYQVDAADRGSIERLFRDIGAFDALVSLAGGARFKPVAELTDEDFEFSLRHKLMGQINLVRAGLPHVRDGGSFTLTSGVLSQEPMPGSSPEPPSGAAPAAPAARGQGGSGEPISSSRIRWPRSTNHRDRRNRRRGTAGGTRRTCPGLQCG